MRIETKTIPYPNRRKSEMNPDDAEENGSVPMGDLHDLADAVKRGEVEPTEDQERAIAELLGKDWRES